MQNQNEIAHYLCMLSRRSNHHEDSTFSELVSSLSPLHPSKKGGFVEVDGKLDVHERLVQSNIAVVGSERSRHPCAEHFLKSSVLAFVGAGLKPAPTNVRPRCA